MTTQDTAEAISLAGKYLSFKLGTEEYGLEILKVQEIIGIMNITHVPRTPRSVRGVINLRGRIIPVIDLRTKFGLETQEDTRKTCIIFVQVIRNEKSVTMGITVDEVSEVLDILEDQIEETPELGSGVESNFIMGMGKVAEKVIMLLDIDSVLTIDEVALAEDQTQTTDSEEAA